MSVQVTSQAHVFGKCLCAAVLHGTWLVYICTGCVKLIAAATLTLHVLTWQNFAEIRGADQQTGGAVPARQYCCCRVGNSGLHAGKACCMNNSYTADGQDLQANFAAAVRQA